MHKNFGATVRLGRFFPSRLIKNAVRPSKWRLTVGISKEYRQHRRTVWCVCLSLLLWLSYYYYDMMPERRITFARRRCIGAQNLTSNHDLVKTLPNVERVIYFERGATANRRDRTALTFKNGRTAAAAAYIILIIEQNARTPQSLD